MRKLHRVGDEPLKGEFCTLLGASRPSVNKYLAGGGLPWPLPPPDHLVWVTDIDDRSLLWVSPSLATALQYETEEMLGQDARLLLRGQRPSEPGHREAIQALIDDANDGAYHDCESAFVRKDGLWIPLRLRVTYGGLYRVWFANAVQTGVPFVFPAAKQTRQRTERAAVLRHTQSEYGTWRPPPHGSLAPVVSPVSSVEQQATRAQVLPLPMPPMLPQRLIAKEYSAPISSYGRQFDEYWKQLHRELLEDQQH
jgi:hypothetical protein